MDRFLAARAATDGGCDAATAGRFGLEAGSGSAQEAACLEAAFAGDAFWAWQGADAGWVVRFTLAFCARHGAVVVARHEGRVGAVACLVAPGVSADPERAAAVVAEVGLPPPSKENKEDRTGAAGEALRAAQERVCGAGKRWHLWMLGTHPDCSGRGLAKQLLALCCHLGDRDRLPLYLETDSAAALYRRFGFETAERFAVLDYALPVEAMLRTPRPLTDWPSDAELQTVGEKGRFWIPLDAQGHGLELSDGREWRRSDVKQTGKLEWADTGDDAAWLSELWAWDDGRDPLCDVYRLRGAKGEYCSVPLSANASRESFLRFAAALCGSRQALLWQHSVNCFAPIVNGQLPSNRRAMRPSLLLARPLRGGSSLVFGKQVEGCICLLEEADKKMLVSAPGDTAALVARHYERHLAGLPLVDRLLIDSWHSPPLIRDDEFLPAALWAVFRDNGPRVALTTADGVSLTFAQLSRRVATLRKLLPAAGTAVAVLCHSSAAYVVSLCACLFSGCPYVPVDPSYPLARVRMMLQDAKAELLLSETGISCLPETRTVRVDELGESDEELGPVAVTASSPAYVIYTSGSTGRPKGALIEHRGVLGMLRGVQQLARLSASDSALHFYGVAFDGSVVNVFLPLLAAARLVMRGSGAAWLPLMRGTSVGFLTPSVLAVLDDAVLAQLRLILVGGEALSQAAALRAKCALLNIYGPTETTVISSAALLPVGTAAIHAGPPLPGVKYAVVRPEAELPELPEGCVGELLIGGRGVGREYLNLPEKTAASFVTWRDGERWYRSGDLARWRGDGAVQVLGRAEAGQVKVAGYRIELREVETALESQPRVRLAAVVVFGDALVAFVAPESAIVNTAELAKLLPPYMLPARVELRSDLPRTANGKIDTAALGASLTATPSLSTASPGVDSGLLQRFAQLCQHALSLSVVPSPEQPLSDLNSLSAVRLVSMARREMGLNLSLESVLRGRTPLRALLADAGPPEAGHTSSIAPVSREKNTFALSRGQERLLALQLQSPHSCTYNVPVFYRFAGVEGSQLADAVRKLFARHETLRLVFPANALAQSVGAHAGKVTLLQGSQNLDEVAAKELMLPFDVHVNCARATVLSVEGGAAMLLCCHHLIVDGLSIAHLLRDLSAFLRSESLAPLRLQFVDFAAAESEAVSTERVSGWLAQHEHSLRRLPPPVIPSALEPMVSASLVEEVSFVAERLPQVTANVVCFGLFLAALQRAGLAPQSDVLCGTVAQNRQLLEGAEDMVGFFVNTVPLRVDFAGLTFGALFNKCRDAFLGAIALQACPFDAVVEHFRLPPLSLFFSFVDFVPTIPGATPVPQAAVCKFGLELEVEVLDGGRRARLTWLYDERRLTRDRVAAAATQYRVLLESVGPALLSQRVQEGLPRLQTTASLTFVSSLSAPELEERAQRLFRAAPLLGQGESEFVVQHLETLDQAEPGMPRPRFRLALLVPESGPCHVRLSATCCDRPSLVRCARHLQSAADLGLLIEAMLAEPDDVSAALAHWTSRLAGAPLLADLPTDRVRAPVLGDATGVYQSTGPLVVDAATLSMAVGVVLGRHCVRQSSIIVGHVVSVAQPSAAVGQLTNVVPLLVDCSGDASLNALAVAARKMLDEAPQSLPFELVAAALDPDAGAGRAALAQVSAALLPAPTVEGLVAHGPLFLGEIAVESDGTGRFWWFFRSDLWDAHSIATLHRHLVTFLSNSMANITSSLTRDISFMDEAEQALLCGGFLERGPAPQARAMHELFLAHCARDLSAAAVWEAGVTTSYGELLAKARRIVLPRRAPVAVLLMRGADCIAAQLAILLRGGTFVPIDPAYPAARIAFILEDASVAALLIHSKTRALVPASFPAAKIVNVEVASSTEEDEKEREEVCYVMYTSGTTGNPKGVMVTHAGVVNYEECWRAWTGCAPGDRCLWFAGVAFDASIENVWCTLASGACVVARSDMWLSDLAECTMIDCTPSALSVVDPLEYPRLRFVSTGAEEMQVSLRNTWCRRVTLFNLYGPTEATVACTGARMLPGSDRDVVTIGRPFWNMQAFIVDPRGELCPLGVPGELCFAGVQVSRGYRNRPDLTADKFLPNRFSSEPGCGTMYRTGDLARLGPDGCVYYLGRLDSQVKLRGFRVELTAVESVLQACPGVEAACVIVLRPGAPDAALAAFCTPANLSEAAVRLECGKTLPPYMVPDRLIFLAALPKTANGKLDKAALIEVANKVSVLGQVANSLETTATPMEREMLAAFAALVGRPVSTQDRFFESGLNSISAMRLAFALKPFGVEVTDILKHQTVAHLARHCESRATNRQDMLVVWLSASKRPSRQAQRIIVLVHGMGGSLGPLRLLAREIHASNPQAVILGLHLVRDTVLRSVAQLAGDYVAAVRRAVGGGVPLILVGCEAAGAVACEMAHQLTRGGEEVSKLLLLGTPFVDERAYDAGEKESEVWRAMAAVCLQYAKRRLSMLPVPTVLFVPPERLEEGMEEALQATLFRQCRCVALPGSAWIEARSAIAEEALEQPAHLDVSLSQSVVTSRALPPSLLRSRTLPLRPLSASRAAAVPRLQRLELSQSLRASALNVSQLRLEQSAISSRLLDEMARDCAMPLPFLAPIQSGSAAALPPLLGKNDNASVLLTGATGFIGQALLAALLSNFPGVRRVWCVVRGGAERVASSERVVSWRGNLALPRLGLEEAQWAELEASCDYVVHNGAFVNHVMEYAQMRDTNVLGVLEILRLAAHPARPKRLVVVSTTGVVPVLAGETPMTSAPESVSHAGPADQESGYCQTKYVAEQLCVRARAAGLSVALVRPALIGWARSDGASNPADWLTGLLVASLLVDAVPRTTQRVSLMPVDECALGILLPLTVDRSEPVIHLAHTESVSYELLYEALRRYVLTPRGLPSTDFGEWLGLVRRALEASPQRSRQLAPSLLILGSVGDVPGDRVHATQRAEALGVPRSAPLDAAYFDVMARHLAQAWKQLK